MVDNGAGVFHPNVANLESIKLQDDVPRVQATPQSIDYEVAPQSNLLQYVDHGGYNTELGSEVEAIGELEKVLEVGRMHVNVLYTFRSVSRAIPMVSGSGDPNKNALHMNTFKVLRPEMEKLMAIMIFYESAVQVFCDNIKTLARRGAKKVVPEGLYDALIAVVDLLQKLDYLKDTKACLTNDFSRYKRALTTVRQDLPDAEKLGQEQHSLQLFLGNPKYSKQLIINTLRDRVKDIPGHLEVLIKMLALAVERLETETYMTPDEKYRNIRVVPHLLWLLDGDNDAAGPDGASAFNVFKQRKFKLQPVQRICQRFPVVPQCGDVAIKLSYVLERCPHFDSDSSSAWFSDTPSAPDYSVLAKWGRMTTDFDGYATRLSNAMNEIRSGPFVKTQGNVKVAAKVARLVLLGLRLLQQWSCVVLECMAWKYTHPCPASVFKEKGGNSKGKGMEYERVVRYNWSAKELSALVEVITMTKSLGSLLSRAEGRLAPLLRLHIHAVTQQMAQGDLVPVLHRAFKKKRDIVTNLLQLRSMVSDWSDGTAPAEDYKKYKRAQGRVLVEGKSAAPHRVVGPSSTQLQLVRAMVRAIYDENSELRQSSFLGTEDLKKEDLGLLKKYYEESFGFPYLMDLSGTIRSATDLGDLWYREYHLELTKEVQFPIEMSLPWIIIEHIVKTKKAMALGSSKAGVGGDESTHGGVDGGGKGVSVHGDTDGRLMSYGSSKKGKKKKGQGGGGMGHVLVEEMLWALDLYNDAAHTALYELNSQYLFNEIQAEVNLVFKQLMFDLEAEVFGYFKDWAASTTLDKMYKRVIEKKRGWGHFIPDRRRYETLAQQRHLQLLGRSVDLTQRISGAMNRKITEDLELALGRFESGGLSGILELEGAIETTKMTHLLIQESGLGVDSFSNLWDEVNEVVSPASCSGRVVAHVVRTVVLDLLTNYRYCATTRRLVKSPVELKAVQYPKPPSTLDKNLGGGRMCGKSLEQTYAVGRGFVGSIHLEAMVRVLGLADLPLVVETIIEHMQHKLLDIKDWTDALKGGLPPVKLPKFDFGTAGCYSFMEEKLRPILEYDDLKTGVFQDFRELGNALAFLQCLSEAASGMDCLKCVHTVPVMGLSSSRKWDPKRTRLVAATTALIRGADFTAEAGASLSGLEEAVMEGQDACKGLARSSSIFRHTLGELDAALDSLKLRDAWAGNRPSNGVMDVEESMAFSRLFSALNFLFCMPEAAGEPRVTDAVQFGDGFGLAGAVIMHLMRQRHQFELLDFSYHVLNVHNYERAGLKDGVTGRNVDPAKARETEAFLHEAYRALCLMFDAFSVAEAVLPSRPSGQAAEVRIFHPPKDDTKVNRALLADVGGLWETQDVYGDRQAEAAAKRVQRPSVDKSSLSKPGNARGILRRGSKPALSSEADRIEEEKRKKNLSTFTYALGAFISGGEGSKPAPGLPAPISSDLLASAGMKTPTDVGHPVDVGSTVDKPSLSPPGPGAVSSGAVTASAAPRAKPPAGAPPPPMKTGGGGVPARPPPPSGAPMPGGGSFSKTTSSSVRESEAPQSERGQMPRARSVSPTGSSFGDFSAMVALGENSLQIKESRSADNLSELSSGSLPDGAKSIMEMGFSERKARAALARSGGNAEQAVEWLLSNPPSPTDKDKRDKPRPTAPPPSAIPTAASTSTSPLQKKAHTKKPKAATPQNPVFDQKAFTPVLIPAKPGADLPWTSTPGVLQLAAPVGPNPGGLDQGLGTAPGQVSRPTSMTLPQDRRVDGGMIRPRSTPDVISALDPDSVQRFEPSRTASLQQQQGNPQQSPPSTPDVGGDTAGLGAKGMIRRQSAPSGLSPGKLAQAQPASPPHVSQPTPQQLSPPQPLQQLQQQQQLIPPQEKQQNQRQQQLFPPPQQFHQQLPRPQQQPPPQQQLPPQQLQQQLPPPQQFQQQLPRPQKQPPSQQQLPPQQQQLPPQQQRQQQPPTQQLQQQLPRPQQFQQQLPRPQQFQQQLPRPQQQPPPQQQQLPPQQQRQQQLTPPHSQQRPSPQQQLQKQGSATRAPAPSGPAPVGGGLARGPARTPVPRGPAAVGGSMKMDYNNIPGGLSVGRGYLGQVRPQFPQIQSIMLRPTGPTMQQSAMAMQPQGRPPMQTSPPMQATKTLAPQQVGGVMSAGSGGIPQLMPKATVPGTMTSLLPPSQQQQQQQQQCQDLAVMPQGRGQVPGGTAMVSSGGSSGGHPQSGMGQMVMQPRPQVLLTQQQQQQQQPRPIPILQPRPAQPRQQQPQSRPHQPIQVQQQQQMGRTPMPMQHFPGQLQERPLPQQQQQGMLRPQQGIVPGIQQGMPSGPGQSGRPVSMTSTGPGPQQMYPQQQQQQQQQPRLNNGNMGFNSMQQQMQPPNLLQGQGGNMNMNVARGMGQFGQPALNPQQQQQQQQQQFNPRR